jgi:hypothetical protein
MDPKKEVGWFWNVSPLSAERATFLLLPFVSKQTLLRSQLHFEAVLWETYQCLSLS